MHHRYPRTSRPEIKEWFYGKKKQETIWPGGKSSDEETFSVHLITSSNNMETMLLKSTDWNTIENFEDNDGKIHHVAASRSLFSKLEATLKIVNDSQLHDEFFHHCPQSFL